jgi:diguanylate cyclase (GGDEF)-like protein
MKNQQSTGLTLVCNDLGEIEQVIQDGLGIVPAEEGKYGKQVFLRLIDRTSLDKARAFLTDLRISRKVPDIELALQTKGGPINALFAGVKSGNQFVIVAAQTAEARDRLFQEVLVSVDEHAEQQARMVTRPLKARFPEEPPPTPEPEKKQPAEPENLTVELEQTRSELAKTGEELEKVQQDFYELATIDTITGLYNRRHFIKRLKEELREAERYKRSPAFLLIDIDGFRETNDRYGLQTGDEIIRSVGEVVQGVLRKVDMVGRLNGDEFGALLLETTRESCLLVAKRLQKKISGVAIEVGGRSFHVTVSMALLHTPDGKITADKLLKQAEKMLEQAKASGGNQIIQDE